MSGARWQELKVSGEVLRVRWDWWLQLGAPVARYEGCPLHRFESNGCSFSPDSWRHRKLWPACHVHDFEYSEKYAVGTRAGRRAADARLRRNLCTLVRLQGGGRGEAARVSWIYWGRVRVWGADHYAWKGGERPESLLHRLKEAWLPW